MTAETQKDVHSAGINQAFKVKEEVIKRLSDTNNKIKLDQEEKSV